MNLREAKLKAISLIAEYSVDGILIAEGENIDYLNRMNRFASDAQFEIADRVGIETSAFFDQIGTGEFGSNRYELPPDYKEHLKLLRDGEPFTNYQISNKKLVLNKGLTGVFELIYNKNPLELTDITSDSYEFEVDIHVQPLIPYFMGGMAIADEDTVRSDRLLNIYFARLEKIEKKHEDYPNDIQIIFTV